MNPEPYRTMNSSRYDVATEVFSSAVRILRAVGFDEREIPKLFGQVANMPPRGPIWIEPLDAKPRGS